MIFKNGMTPALSMTELGTLFLDCVTKKRGVKSHNTPMLIANRIPILSFLFIATGQTILHGSIASVISAKPENATE